MSLEAQLREAARARRATFFPATAPRPVEDEPVSQVARVEEPPAPKGIGRAAREAMRRARVERLERKLRGISPASPIRTTQIVVCLHYGVAIEDMCSARRNMLVVRARHVAMYLAKRRTLKSLPEIGRHFGGRDHTTVLHACRKVAALEASDEKFRYEVWEVDQKLGEALR